MFINLLFESVVKERVGFSYLEMRLHFIALTVMKEIKPVHVVGSRGAKLLGDLRVGLAEGCPLMLGGLISQ